MLKWETASEINNDYFIIERSRSAEGFESIGKVPGANNSEQIRYYSFTDHKPWEGINYYRLTQVDFDGERTSSYIIALNFIKSIDQTIQVKSYAKQLLISSFEDLVELNLYSMDGRLVKQFADLQGQRLFDLADLPQGNFVVRVKTHTMTKSHKVAIF